MFHTVGLNVGDADVEAITNAGSIRRWYKAELVGRGRAYPAASPRRASGVRS